MLQLNKISGNIVDPVNQEIYGASLIIQNGKIVDIIRTDEVFDHYILPGFVDAHVHIESSMLTPCEFARLATPHGTIATVSDPHEIGNVLGIAGVRYMLDNAAQTLFKCYFGAPSCVPATTFETAGATITIQDIEALFQDDQIKYLSEMMNFPGVLYKDPIVLEKIALAKQYNRPIDGHAPGLRGEQAKQYIDAGITTDHECFTLAEAQDKLKYGMNILIREGSAAKNYEALIPLLENPTNATKIMFCSDDKHPNDLVVGHINELVKRSIDRGIDLMTVLQAACVNPVRHYNLEVGLLQKNDPADFIVVNNLTDLHIQQTYINGQLVAENGKSLLDYQKTLTVNHFVKDFKTPKDFAIKATGSQMRVIEALDGQLITNEIICPTKIENGWAVTDVTQDILKLAVVNRYQSAAPALAFIKNFGLKRGAIASSVAHDSHNIIAVGTTDEAICQAVNALMEAEGGLAVVDPPQQLQEILSLPIAGIMTNENGYQIAQQYTKIDRLAKQLGSTLYSPYMTLSFMGLLVIPSLKLSDKGLFDGNQFTFTNVFTD